MASRCEVVQQMNRASSRWLYIRFLNISETCKSKHERTCKENAQHLPQRRSQVATSDSPGGLRSCFHAATASVRGSVVNALRETLPGA